MQSRRWEKRVTFAAVGDHAQVEVVGHVDDLERGDLGQLGRQGLQVVVLEFEDGQGAHEADVGRQVLQPVLAQDEFLALVQTANLVRQMLEFVPVEDQAAEAFQLANGRRQLDEFVEGGPEFPQHVQVADGGGKLEHVVVTDVEDEEGLRAVPDPVVQIDPRTVRQIQEPVNIGLDQDGVVIVVHGDGEVNTVRRR